MNWELRHTSKNWVDPSSGGGGWFSDSFPVVPGTYTAEMSVIDNGEVTKLSEPISFDVVPLQEGALERKPDSRRKAFMENLIAFQRDLTATSDLLMSKWIE